MILHNALQDERIQEAMDAARGRFKVAAAALGLHDVYAPAAGNDAGALAF